MPASADHDYAVLGDLRGTVDGYGGPRIPAGRFIVRMFVGDHVFDEEIDAHIDELHDVVHKRMAALARKPDAKLKADSERPVVHPGHAVAVPGHDLSAPALT